MSLQTPSFSDPALQAEQVASPLLLAGSLQKQIEQFTQELFSSPVEILAELDPETDEKYFAVYVAADHEVAEIVRLNDAWHRRLLHTAGKSAGLYRLALNIR
jgi:hypothetical protein